MKNLNDAILRTLSRLNPWNKKGVSVLLKFFVVAAVMLQTAAYAAPRERPANFDAFLASKPAQGAQAAPGVLRNLAPLYNLDTTDVDGAVVACINNPGHGPIVVTFTNQIDGIEVYGERMAVALDRKQQPVSLSGYLNSA